MRGAEVGGARLPTALDSRNGRVQSDKNGAQHVVAN
jgi:hypothetical protein